MNGHETDDVRRLIGTALGGEPAMGLRPDEVLGLARRREKRLRLASVGGVVGTVAAATVGVMMLTGPSAAQDGPGPLVPGASVEISQRPPEPPAPPTKAPRQSSRHEMDSREAREDPERSPRTVPSERIEPSAPSAPRRQVPSGESSAATPEVPRDRPTAPTAAPDGSPDSP